MLLSCGEGFTHLSKSTCNVAINLTWFNICVPQALFDTSYQLPQITTFNPLLLSTAANAQTSSSSSTSNTPTFSNLAHYTSGLPANHGPGSNDHVCWHHRMWQDLNVLLDDCEGLYGHVGADVNV